MFIIGLIIGDCTLLCNLFFGLVGAFIFLLGFSTTFIGLWGIQKLFNQGPR